MPHDNPYEVWLRSRSNVDVPDDFADRVIKAIRQSEDLGRRRAGGRFLMMLLASRVGRVAVCTSAIVLFVVRVTHVFSLFVTQ